MVLMSVSCFPLRFSEMLKMLVSARSMTSAAVVGLLEGLRDDAVGGVDEAAQHRLVTHDADVMLDGGAARHAIGERGEIASSADGFQLFVAAAAPR